MQRTRPNGETRARDGVLELTGIAVPYGVEVQSNATDAINA